MRLPWNEISENKYAWNGNGCGKDMILRLRFKFGMIGFLPFYLGMGCVDMR